MTSRAATLVKLALSKRKDAKDTKECESEPQPGCSTWDTALPEPRADSDNDPESDMDFEPSESSYHPSEANEIGMKTNT